MTPHSPQSDHWGWRKDDPNGPVQIWSPSASVFAVETHQLASMTGCFTKQMWLLPLVPSRDYQTTRTPFDLVAGASGSEGKRIHSPSALD